MRILLSGALNPAFAALPEYLRDALTALGHDVRLFDHRGFLIPGRARARLPVLERFDRRLLNARFVRAAAGFRPGLVVVNQGMVLTRATIAAVRGLGARCVNWFSDYPMEFDAGLAIADAYDTFFCASSYAVERHRALGRARSRWLPFGCPLDPPPAAGADGGAGDEASPPAVVFVGSWYPERQVLLRFLRGLPIGIWGPGWRRAEGDPHLRGMLRGAACRPAAWRRLFARARVAVNIHYGAFGPRDVSGDLANTRVFEILAAGGACQVVDRAGDVLRLFRDGEHLVTFAGGDELRARVEALLADEEGARRLARLGRDEVLARHTYRERALLLCDPEARAGALHEDPPAGRPARRAS